jgi:cell division protein YceG involved in septum cleavage
MHNEEENAFLFLGLWFFLFSSFCLVASTAFSCENISNTHKEENIFIRKGSGTHQVKRSKEEKNPQA